MLNYNNYQVSKITSAMRDTLVSNIEKYFEAMESTWEIHRPLYISMLNMFLEKCTSYKKLSNAV